MVRKSKRNEFVGSIQGKLTIAEYAQTFEGLARFAPDMIPTDRARRDKFIKGLDSMVARDVRVTMSKADITYAQTVERALATERTVQLSAREHAASRETKRTAQAAAGAQRIGGSGDQKIRFQN